MGLRESMKTFIVLAVLLLPAASFAAVFGNDDEEKQWTEIEVQLPDYPQKENLIPFRVGAIDDTQYLIDGTTLSVGSDGVLRYTLVVISSAGAENVSYEGMRCATAERRFYAFGRSDKTWSKARSNPWVKIQGSSNNHHVELYSNYFCTVGAASITSADDARRVLRSGGQIQTKGR
jgi:hypothetical protein